MSTNIKTYNIKCLKEYIDRVSELYELKNKNFRESRDSNMFFFRGHGDAKFKLLPKVFRENKIPFDERKILLNYRDHLPRNVHDVRFDFVKDRIEILVEMQHYLLPTRLLDWSLSPLIALYFAVREDEHINKDACVWVFNPWKLYSSMQEEMGYTIDNWFNMMKLGRALLSDRKTPQIMRDLKAIFNADQYLCNSEYELPLGFIAQYQNNRMIQQSSVFTIHGTKITPIEEITGMLEYLIKIKIPAAKKLTILKDLNMLYINEYTVYPDFVGMGREIEKKGSLYYFDLNSYGNETD